MYIAYTDAGYNNNTKTGGYYSFKLYDEKELITHKENIQLPDSIGTSNRAEYTGMINLLNYILNAGLESKDIVIYSDSQLVVKQLNNVFNVNNKDIKILYNQAKVLLDEIRTYCEVTIIWKPRKVFVKILGH